MRNVIREFKKFALKGSVIDLAVGIIIGAAFNSIVQSLVNDIIMPPIGYLGGGMDFSELYFTLGAEQFDSLAEAEAAGAATINYGLFLNQVISFMIIALAVFFIIRLINRLRDQQTNEPPPTASTRPCPFCYSEISRQATRCPFCTARIEPYVDQPTEE